MACCCAKRAGLEETLGGKCEDCRAWEEELYWKRFQPLHFCQILGPNGEFQKQLVIPKKFADNAKAILPPKVTLRGPSGASWHAIMTTQGGDLILSDGWEEFVRAYSLQASNILIFKYDGISVFDVLIFDGENLCEKESTYFVKKCRHANLFAERQRKRVLSEFDIEENNDNHIHEATKRPREGVGKNSVGETPKRSKCSLLCSRSKANPRKNAPLGSSEDLSDPSVILAELGKSIAQNVSSNQEPQNTAEINGSCATEAPNQKDDNGSFSTEAPSQDTPQPQVNGSLLIVYEASPQNTLQMNGSFHTEASAQNGKETDGRCLKDATPQKSSLARGRSKRGLGSLGKKKAVAASGETQPEASSKKVASSAGRLKRQVQATKAADGTPLRSAGSSNKKHVPERGKVALEVARKQMTESSFVVLMRPTSVHRRFVVTIPPAWYKKHLSPNSQDVFLRLEDKTWLARLSYSACKATGTIYGGWKQFVQENQLEEFDACLFNFASQKDDLVMLDVSIFRAGAAMTDPPNQVTNGLSMTP